MTPFSCGWRLQSVTAQMAMAAAVHLEELMRLLPNNLELMQSLLHVLDASSDSNMAARAHALLLLQELLEDLDKATDFRNAMDGYPVLAALLANTSEPAELHERAAWVVGTAAQNQRDLQLHLLEVGVLPSLLRLVRAGAAPVAARAKALYAVSALVRNNPEGQHAFEAHAGLDALLAAVGSAEPRLVRKALVLLADLIHESLAAGAAAASGRPTYDGHLHSMRPPRPLWLERGAAGRGGLLCGAVLACLRMRDADSLEKAAVALKHLHAAGLIGDGGGGNDEEEEEQPADGAGSCLGVPDELSRLVALCEQGGGAEALNCEELRPMLRELRKRFRSGTAMRTIETDTVFHLEI